MSDAFHSLYKQGFARIAACTLPVSLADPRANAARVLDVLARCDRDGVAAVVFPELGLTGYTLDDLRFQDVVLDAALDALRELREASRRFLSVAVVGLPLARGDLLYNCAAVIHRGRILGIVPKSWLPNYREFYDARHFSPGLGTTGTVALSGEDVPFGADLLFAATDVRGLTLGVEICEDLWVAQPPSGALARAGATVLLNPSASPVTIGRADDRDLLCRSQSMRTIAAYAYAAAGEGESTTDLAWDGQVSIHEAGVPLARSDRFPDGERVITADVDLDLIRQERVRTGQFGPPPGAPFRTVGFRLAPSSADLGLRRDVPRFPFVPADPATLARDCYEAWTIQVSALRRRLAASGARRAVIGVSGGLDSTLALLVAARAADELGWPRTHVLAYTMPGFATGAQSLGLAHALMEALGVSAHELDIRPAAQEILAGIGHPFATGEPVYDVTFENVQAGVRSDFLFRLANRNDGIVIGTGDLSELALGWCTYGVGDQMSHYNVNTGMPKTLIQHVIRWLARKEGAGSTTGPVLERIVSAEITPELVPDTGAGVQSTEGTIGPYALHDFALYHVLRHGFRPSRIAFLAERAWADPARGEWPQNYPEDRKNAYDLAEIRRWLAVFLRRFFATSQFKRSAAPNGPKIAAGGSLSPRGDWRAPSDGNAEAWLAELERNVPRE